MPVVYCDRSAESMSETYNIHADRKDIMEVAVKEKVCVSDIDAEYRVIIQGFTDVMKTSNNSSEISNVKWFWFMNYKFKLLIYPNGNTEEDKGFVSIFLFCDNPEALWVNGEISIGGIRHPLTMFPLQDKIGRGFPKFLSHSAVVFEDWMPKLKDETLEIVCKITRIFMEPSMKQSSVNPDQDISSTVTKIEEMIRSQTEAQTSSIEQLKYAHSAEIEKLKETHKKDIDELKAAHAKTIEELKDVHEKGIRGFNSYINNLIKSHDEHINDMKSAHDKEVTAMKRSPQLEEDKTQFLHNDVLSRLHSYHSDLVCRLDASRNDQANRQIMMQTDIASRHDSIQAKFNVQTSWNTAFNEGLNRIMTLVNTVKEVVNMVMTVMQELASNSSKQNETVSKLDEGMTNMNKALAKLLTRGGEKIPKPKCHDCRANFLPNTSIAQCLSGHLYCSICKTYNEEICPVCLESLNGRALSMENYLKILFPSIEEDFEILSQSVQPKEIIDIESDCE